MLVFTAITPHPPIIIPEIGREELSRCSETVNAMKELGRRFIESRPEEIIIISPHAPILPHRFAVNISPELTGDFSRFGYTDWSFSAVGNGTKWLEALNNDKAVGIDNTALDHGALVPLYYLNPVDIPLTVLSFCDLAPAKHLAFGRALRQAIDASEKRVALIASGDLSHRLTPEAPAGYSPRGREFDEAVVAIVKSGELDQLTELDPELIDAAGECGWRSFCVLAGATGSPMSTDVLSYKGPFGVGYLVAEITDKT